MRTPDFRPKGNESQDTKNSGLLFENLHSAVRRSLVALAEGTGGRRCLQTALLQESKIKGNIQVVGSEERVNFLTERLSGFCKEREEGL